jgi:hypothetical protein
MEPLWSPVVATGGNQSQIRPAPKRRKQAKTVAVGCDRLPREVHGKEGVDGSSPSEGSAKAPQSGAFSFAWTCTMPACIGYGALYGAFGSKIALHSAARCRRIRRHREVAAWSSRRTEPFQHFGAFRRRLGLTGHKTSAAAQKQSLASSQLPVGCVNSVTTDLQGNPASRQTGPPSQRYRPSAVTDRLIKCRRRSQPAATRSRQRTALPRLDPRAPSSRPTSRAQSSG